MLVVLQVLVQQCQKKIIPMRKKTIIIILFKLRVLQLATQLTNTTYFSSFLIKYVKASKNIVLYISVISPNDYELFMTFFSEGYNLHNMT